MAKRKVKKEDEIVAKVESDNVDSTPAPKFEEWNPNIIVPGSFWCNTLGKSIFKGVYVAKDKKEYDIVKKDIKKLGLE